MVDNVFSALAEHIQSEYDALEVERSRSLTYASNEATYMISRLVEPSFVVVQQIQNEWYAVHLPKVRIRRVADHDGDAFMPLDFIHGFRFVRQGVEANERELLCPRLKGVR